MVVWKHDVDLTGKDIIQPRQRSTWWYQRKEQNRSNSYWSIHGGLILSSAQIVVQSLISWSNLNSTLLVHRPPVHKPPGDTCSVPKRDVPLDSYGWPGWQPLVIGCFWLFLILPLYSTLNCLTRLVWCTFFQHNLTIQVYSYFFHFEKTILNTLDQNHTKTFLTVKNRNMFQWNMNFKFRKLQI